MTIHYIMAIAGFIWLIASHINNTKQRILAKLIVTKAAINDDEFTDISADDDFYFVFYRIGSKPLTLSGVMGANQKQFFGEVYGVDEAGLFSKTSPVKHELHSFNWTYESGPGNAKSKAVVKIIKTSSNDCVAIDLAILNQDRSRFLFKGYVE